MTERVRILHGDNEELLNKLYCDGERFVLAYLDPPFFSQEDYKTTEGEVAFTDTWLSLDEYLRELEHTIALARDTLTEEGSLVLHLDQSASHYAKVCGDRVFGRNCFVSEIVWRYRRWPTKTRNFQRMHDTLLRWVRDPTGEPRFNQLFEPLADSTLEQWGTGKQRAVHNHNGRRVRSVTTEELARCPLSDVWDISIVAPSSNERTGWPTQKPEELYARIVDSLSNEGEAVVDPFCGSGTMPAVCAERGRRCVGIDKSEKAVAIATARVAPLLAQGSLFGGAA